jgi:hypothetical protein
MSVENDEGLGVSREMKGDSVGAKFGGECAKGCGGLSGGEIGAIGGASGPAAFTQELNRVWQRAEVAGGQLRGEGLSKRGGCCRGEGDGASDLRLSVERSAPDARRYRAADKLAVGRLARHGPVEGDLIGYALAGEVGDWLRKVERRRLGSGGGAAAGEAEAGGGQGDSGGDSGQIGWNAHRIQFIRTACSQV